MGNPEAVRCGTPAGTSLQVPHVTGFDPSDLRFHPVVLGRPMLTGPGDDRSVGELLKGTLRSGL